MALLKLGPHLLDTSQVTYVSSQDKDLKHHINVSVHFFTVVVAGALIKLTFEDLETCASNRDTLLKTLHIL